MDTEYRDDKGRFTQGNPGSPGRPVFSIVSIIKDELQHTPDGSDEPLIRSIIRDYIADAQARNDGTAIRDIIDRFDGKPKQHVAVSDERKEAWRELQHSVFTEPETADDMEALPGSSTEATNIRGRSTFGEDLA